MSRRDVGLTAAVLLVAPVAFGDDDPGAEIAPAAAEATYHRHVVPIVKRSCVGCHGGKRPKGKLSMESLGRLLAGGKKGSPVVPGKPDESLLYQLLCGAKKPFMPPRKAEPLSEVEILTFRAWIEGGAKAGEPGEAAPYATPPAAPTYSRPPVIAGLAYSADGQRLFVGGYREVLVHDVDRIVAAGAGGVALEPVGRLVGEAERIQDLALSPDGELLAVAAGSPGRFGELQVWAVDSGELVEFRRIGGDVLYAVDFAPDGSRIATAGTDRALHVVSTAGLEDVFASEIHSDWIFGVAYGGDGSRLFSGGRDKTLKVSGAVDGRFLQTLVTFGKSVSGVLGRPGSDQVLVFSETGGARLIGAGDLKEKRQLEKQSGAVLAGAFSRDGKQLALGGVANEVRVYASDDGKRVASLASGPEWTFALAFRPDGGQLAVAGLQGVVRLYDLKESKRIAEVIPVVITVQEAR